MTPPFWSHEEDQQLLRLLRRGLSFRAISDEIGRPIQGCKGRWNKLRERRPRMQKLAAAVYRRSRNVGLRAPNGRYAGSASA